MSLSGLLPLLPPPESPIAALHLDDWGAVQQILGTPVPGDYREFISVYGSGAIDRFVIQVLNLSLEWDRSMSDELCAALASLHEDPYSDQPFPVFPEPGGLLPWGSGDDGDTFCWKTIGEPDDWPIVLFPRWGDVYFEYDLAMTDYLGGLVEGRIESKLSGEWRVDHIYTSYLLGSGAPRG